MKTALIYLHVVAKGYPEAAPPEYYLPFEKRWLETKLHYWVCTDHSVRVVFCGADAPQKIKDMYTSRLPCTFDVYTGGGSDIGACQHALKNVDADFAVCMSTPVYFWKRGWLDCLVAARQYYGDGLYGPMASYQFTPHIRTSCWGVDPKTFAKYPYLIDTREKCCWAEHADHPGKEPWQISRWYESKNMPTMMVTWNSVHAKAEWRTPPNIFRRGDQSNCLVWDQHVDVYFACHYHERLALERAADGK